jgi:hypothetical protein
MGELIHFRGRGGAKDGETAEERARRRDEQAARNQERKHAAIRKKIKDNEMMRKPSERLLVANNLWQILTDLENGEPRASKREVLHVVLPEVDIADLTKRLPYFAVNPEKSKSKEEQRKRAKILTRHIERYVELVQAAAHLSRRNVDDLIERLVEGTSYAWSPDDPELEDLGNEGWNKIEEKLREVSKEIAEKHDLQGFFRRVHELGIGVDSEDNFDQPAGRSEIYARLQKHALPWVIPTDHLPPRPSVELGEIRSGDFPCTIRLEPYAGEGEAEDELFDRLKDSGLETVSFKARACLVLKCWLELVPLGKEDNVTPVLRVSSRTSIRAAETFDKFAAFGGDTFIENETFWTPDGPLEDKTIGGFDLIGAASDEKRNSYAYYALYAELDRDPGDAYWKSIHAEILLDHSRVGWFDNSTRACLIKPALTDGLAGPNRNYCAAAAAKMVGLGLNDAKTLITFFPGGTMAALLERSLFDAPEPARLGQLLDESARARVAKLDAAIDDLRARRRVEGER